MASASGDSEVKKRKDNWVVEETIELAKLYQEHSEVIKGDFTKCTAKDKAAAWQDIVARLTAAFPRGRTIKDCQKKWQSIQSAAKMRISSYRRELAATGKKDWTCYMAYQNISQG